MLHFSWKAYYTAQDVNNFATTCTKIPNSQQNFRLISNMLQSLWYVPVNKQLAYLNLSVNWNKGTH